MSMHARLTKLFVCLFAIAGLASAQVVTSTIYGLVQDPGGAVIPGASVSATNTGTGAEVTVTTDEIGEFTMSSLQPGAYQLTVTSAGFKTLQRSGLQLAAAQEVRLMLALEIGEVAETIEVTAETPLLNAVNAEQQKNLESSELVDLPTRRRDWTNLLNLSTGAQSSGGTVRMNGLAPSAFRFTVDGTDASQDTEYPSFSMTGNFNFIKGVSTEAIDQVNIITGIASAEVANTMSGNVNVITKSGTNQFHGSAFWLFNAEELNARNQFLSNKPNLTFNQFGGSLGGPIVKNKAFFFGVFEGYRQRGFRALSDDVPTPEFKQMVSASTKIYDATLALFPEPNQPYDPGDRTGEWIGSASDKADDDHVLGRGDYHVTDHLIFSARYTRGRPTQVTPRVVPANSRIYDGKIEQGNIRTTYIRPTMTFETRFGVNYNNVPRLDGFFSLFDEDPTKYNGIRGLGFDVSGEVLEREGWSYSIEEVVGMVSGKHSLKFGGIFQRTSGRRDNEESPQVQYANVADLLANIPSGRRVTMGVSPYLASFNTIGFFVQDDFKVSQRLVLNLGIRWDKYTVPRERDGRLFNRAEPFGFGPFIDPDQVWEPSNTNFSPRIGFAYNPGQGSKTVIRGGAGQFYNPRVLYGGPVDIVRDAIDEPFRVSFSRQDALDNPEIFAWPISNDTVRAFAKGSTGLESGTAINPDFPYPFSYQWNLWIQRQITPDVVIETGYVGTAGRNLMMVRFANQPDRITGIRPNPNFAEFRYRDAGERTIYHSWQTSLRKRFQRGFSVGLNHTWASSYSYTDDADLRLPAAPQDFNNVRIEKAPFDSFQRHRFNSNVVYELPLEKLVADPSLLTRNLLGGWQIAAFFTAVTGQPENITQSTALASSRPDFVGTDAPVLSDFKDTLVYLDKNAFARVPLGEMSGIPIRPGNVGRNAVYGPGLSDVDLSLAKRFALGESMGLKFDAQMFNAFNHTNLSDLETRVDRGAFGRLRGTRGARIIQMGLRFEF